MKTALYIASTQALRYAALFVACLISLPLQAAPTFKMAFGQNPDEEAQYLFYKQVYTEAFKELGYEFEYKVCPSKRCSMDANRGYVDGEPQRILKYNETYKNMVRVEEPIFVNRSIAVAINPSIRINGLASLNNTKLRVDYIRGSVWSKRHLEPLVQPGLLTEISTAEQAIKRLVVDHTDILIGLEASTPRPPETPEPKEYPVTAAGIVGENFSYPFVYKSHEELAPKLAEVLQRMKEDGRFNQALSQTMPFMSPQHASNTE
jgi:hypothetical protein